MPRQPDCKLCGLCNLEGHVITPCMFGEGPVPARGMIVGQNPGKEEDSVGRPFVGPSGRMLDDLLEEAGLHRAELYVTNAVKGYTAGNREPTLSELKACRGYLLEEVGAVRPSVVLALGNIALRSLTGRSGITRQRGRELYLHRDYALPEVPVIAAPHPAAGLRYPRYKEMLREDLARFRRALGEGQEPPVIIHYDEPYIPTEVLAFDIETRGFDPNLPGFEILMLGVSSVGTPDVYIYTDDWMFTAARALYADQQAGRKLVAWNAKFDSRVLHQLYDVDLRPQDPMLMAYLLQEDTRHDLKSMAVTKLGVPHWEHGVLEAVSKSEEGFPFLQLANYCARDCLYTGMLYKELKRDLLKDPALARLYRHLMLPAMWMFRDMEERGVYIDREQILRAAREAARKVRAAGKAIEAEGLKHNTFINPNAPHDIARLLYKVLHLPVGQWTETGAESTDKLALKRIRQHHPIVERVLEYRLWAKRMTTYIRPYWQMTKIRPRVYPTFHQHFTVTGRTSCSGPNIQQIPREPLLRSMVAAPPGKVLVLADYSQIELRVGAFISREPHMLEAFRQGQDLHLLMAEKITGKPLAEITKEERTRAKVTNFGFLYGAEPPTFIDQALVQYDMVISYEEAERYREAFFAMWPGLWDWYAQVAEELKRNRYVRSPLGQIRHLPNIDSPNLNIRKEALREAINFPVQNMAGHLLVLALIEINRALSGTAVFEVHDSLALEVDERNARTAAATVKVAMETAVPRILQETFDVHLDVPLVADISISQHWS